MPAKVPRASRSLGSAVFLAALYLAGCVGTLGQWGAETSLVSKKPSFDPTVLHQERVAVLNAVVGFGLEGYSHQVSRSLFSALSEDCPAVKSVSPQEALSRINRARLGKEYAAMMAEYVHSGIMDQTVLERIGQAIPASYVFQPSMAAFSQQMSGRLSFLGLRIFQTRISMLRLSLQLWDTRSGEIVWEASGEATLSGEDVREFRIPFEHIAERLWQRILRDLKGAGE